ncbi:MULTISPECIES: DUF1345 domain-containing protein [unclassified Paenibacillus]|uniref:DUF1345 domain-containing protein n=1 Tax=unclassified Paenibacillus TaxID=185978 RepID=UPI00104B02C4|nr:MULTISPECIES: DUF1345 domain-containing protein [unclassified Paenibacillus]NIK70485.1 putative membrane protein [Paenibacillus sp. BK720]TCM90981.1 hypothetical protein EV294_10958 [Paenibacillus sp. BK033]
MKRHSSRWGYFTVIIVISILLSYLPEKLTVLQSWTLPALAVCMLATLIISILRRHHEWIRTFAIITNSMVMLGLISSVVILLHQLFTHVASASELFGSALVLWVTNIFVFSVWYWEIDRGGPNARNEQAERIPDFLFPQMTREDLKAWSPAFFDYLFLAFNTNTAFSPTDTLVLSKKAKVLTMMQSSISLVIVAVLAARAINIA